MNKTVLTTTLALGLGVTLAGQSADASAFTKEDSVKIDKAHLADLAMNHQSQLNQAPIQEGAYDYEFDYNGYHFDFESDGSTWTWKYHTAGYTPVSAPAQNVQAVAAPVAQPAAVQAPVSYKAPVQQTYTAPVQQTYTAPVQQTYTAPVQQQTYQAPAKTYQAPAYTAPKAATTQTASSNSGVYVNDHLRAIAQRESGGNLRAINPTSGAAGKYQFLQSTWDIVAPAGWVGKSPASAPESVQDAAAVKLYNEYGAHHWVTA
ncbi:transglycosylase family protein [Macrococcus carouselicus]|uniref:Transglycosylase n=1 Tax=Macrococcus carouselicus TaxID=69969 RepID=A0A9Q8CIC2_9STAP|nr:transglycosylase family protein [Macrococcus carouselicus]TDM02406.1 transglycosylase [Macrococcus carouselicus]